MATIDTDHQDLVYRTLVMGAASQLFVESLPLENGSYSPGEVQGWRPRFTFETFPADPWADDGHFGTALERMVPYTDALVLTDALHQGMHYSSGAVERLSRTLGPLGARLPAAIFGSAALAQEWETLSGKKTLAIVEPTAAQAMAVIKALAKALFRSKMRSTPPPPPVDSA
jgi:hypothetical protein